MKPAGPGAELRFVRRVGPDPHAGGAQTEALQNCPDLWELSDGSFVAIGVDVTELTQGRLPPTAGCGPDERVVWLPRRLLIAARESLPRE